MNDFAWYPSATGDREHAVIGGRVTVDGLAFTGCSKSRPLKITRDGAGRDLQRCEMCERAVGRVCGTYGGYQYHKKNGDPFCEPCRKANAAYSRELRKRSPRAANYTRLTNNARSRALWRLADEFHDRFQSLYLEELAELRREAS